MEFAVAVAAVLVAAVAVGAPLTAPDASGPLSPVVPDPSGRSRDGVGTGAGTVGNGAADTADAAAPLAPHAEGVLQPGRQPTAPTRIGARIVAGVGARTLLLLGAEAADGGYAFGGRSVAHATEVEGGEEAVAPIVGVGSELAGSGGGVGGGLVVSGRCEQGGAIGRGEFVVLGGRSISFGRVCPGRTQVDATSEGKKS